MTRANLLSMAEAEARTGECLEFLRSLVEIESPTGNATANVAVADLLADALVAVGGRVERMPAPGLGEHLLARIAGLERHGPPLLVLGHMDTVHPVGTLERNPFAVNGARVTGPGIYDMKSGLAVAIVALRLLAAKGRRPASDISLLITCDEERGSPDSWETIEAQARASRAALVLEPSAPGGAVKSRRKGVSAYELTVKGRPAHAGIEPEAGASAIHEIARQICRILELADPDQGTTINVGVVEGGTAENVVASSARCTLDVRFWTSGEAERIDRAMHALQPVDPGCELHLEGGVNRGPLERTEASGRMFATARRLAAQLGFVIEEGATGGGSDGNITAAAGCPTLDGLGPDGGGAHTLQEHILLDDLPRRIGLMAALFEFI